MENLDYGSCVSAIESILLNLNIYDFLIKNDSVYIGGSLPFLMFNEKKLTVDQILSIIDDIDIYTTNCPLLLRNINSQFKVCNIIKTGVNIKFNIKNCAKPLQIITSSFESFCDEVLDGYDCDMVRVGYHPASRKFIFHKAFVKGLSEKKFIVYYERSNGKRIQKLKNRAALYFNSIIEVVKENADGDYRPYWKNRMQIGNICDVNSSPPYIQLYCNKYRCCGCKKITDYLLCKECDKKINDSLNSNPTIPNFPLNNIVVFGGVNGLGKIIADEAELQNISTTRTSRTVKDTDTNSSNVHFDLENGAKISGRLFNKIFEADCVVFNAYQTLENDHSIWTTDINKFNENLALDRFKVNCFGYVKILQQIISARKVLISNSKKYKPKDIIFVCMDANESKFEGKLQDGKHLELNMAKTAFKQIFYTNAQLLASLGIITVFYDPCWLSYHGISVDKIASKSKFLIPPQLCAKVLLNYVKGINVEELYRKKIFAHDTNFYKCANKYLENKVNNNLLLENKKLTSETSSNTKQNKKEIVSISNNMGVLGAVCVGVAIVAVVAYGFVVFALKDVK